MSIYENKHIHVVSSPLDSNSLPVVSNSPVVYNKQQQEQQQHQHHNNNLKKGQNCIDSLLESRLKKLFADCGINSSRRPQHPLKAMHDNDGNWQKPQQIHATHSTAKIHWPSSNNIMSSSSGLPVFVVWFAWHIVAVSQHRNSGALGHKLQRSSCIEQQQQSASSVSASVFHNEHKNELIDGPPSAAATQFAATSSARVDLTHLHSMHTNSNISAAASTSKVNSSISNKSCYTNTIRILCTTNCKTITSRPHRCRFPHRTANHLPMFCTGLAR